MCAVPGWLTLSIQPLHPPHLQQIPPLCLASNYSLATEEYSWLQTPYAGSWSHSYSLVNTLISKAVVYLFYSDWHYLNNSMETHLTHEYTGKTNPRAFFADPQNNKNRSEEIEKRTLELGGRLPRVCDCLLCNRTYRWLYTLIGENRIKFLWGKQENNLVYAWKLKPH